MSDRFGNYDSGSDNASEDVEEPTTFGWLVIFVVLVVAAFLWFHATPAYVHYFLKVGKGGNYQIPGDGTIPGRRPAELAVVMFDVGYGDGFLIQAPDNTTVLLDGGEGKRPSEDDVKAYNWANRLYLPFARQIGLKKIDKLINVVPYSHHHGVYPDLVASPDVEVGDVYLTGYKSYTHAYRRLKVEDVQLKQFEQGRELELGEGPRAKIIYGKGDLRQPRKASHVIYLKYGEISFLFTGDLPESGEKKLILKWGDSLQADLLKVADHGSAEATTSRFLEYVKPAYALLSTSVEGPRKVPAGRVLQTLNRAGVERIFRTDRDGHVAFFVDGQSVRVVQDPFPFLSHR